MKLHPAGHRVLVKLPDIEEKTESGLIVSWGEKSIADQKSTQIAEVIEIGPNAFRAFDDGEPWCKVGDMVFVAKYSGEDRKDPDSGAVFRIINDEDIFAIVELE